MEDFKEIIYFSVGLLIASFLIVLYGYFGSITGEMAVVRHEEIAAGERAAGARRAASYHGRSISGGELITLLRENAVSGGSLVINVDRNAGGQPITMNGENYRLAAFTLERLKTAISQYDRYTAEVSEDYRQINLTKVV